MLRFLVFLLGFAVFYLAVVQLILPALLNKPVLSLFRRESRLDRAKRLRVEALQNKEATQAEIEAIQIETEAKRIRDEAFKDLTGGGKV